MIPIDQLEAMLARFANLRIGLLGDLFLDRYLEIDAERDEVSIETGLTAYQVVAVRNSPGALGTVLNNLAALGIGQLVPVTVLGDDGHGDDLLRALKTLPVDPQHILRRADRLTPTYTKPMRHESDGTMTELNRLDVRSREPLSRDAQQAIEEHLRRAFPECDGWIVLDQIPETDCGTVSFATRALLEQLSRENPHKPVLVDSRRHLGLFQAGCAKGNRAEFLAALGWPEDASQQHVFEAARKMAARTGCTSFCTLGDDGILVTPPSAEQRVVPGIRVTGPIDIVGAGDSATSGIMAALLTGADEFSAAWVGNLVASITVQQVGTTGVARPEQVLARAREAVTAS